MWPAFVDYAPTSDWRSDNSRLHHLFNSTTSWVQVAWTAD